MCFSNNIENEKYFLNNTEMKNSSEEKILQIIIVIKLKVKRHVKKNLRKLVKRSGLCKDCLKD